MVIDCTYCMSTENGLETHSWSIGVPAKFCIAHAHDLAKKLKCSIEIYVKKELFWVVDETDEWYNDPYNDTKADIEDVMIQRVKFIEKKVAKNSCHPVQDRI